MPRFPEVAGFVLAGGASSRMGRDKALVELGGVPMIVRAVRLLGSITAAPIVIGGPGRFLGLDLNAVADDQPGLGPLGGVATALRISSFPWNLIVGCDLPYLTQAWLEYLIRRALDSRVDAVVPQSGTGSEPLCGVYHRRCGPVVGRLLAQGVRKMSDALGALSIGVVTRAESKPFDSEGFLFKNMNSPDDYEEARARLSGEGAN